MKSLNTAYIALAALCLTAACQAEQDAPEERAERAVQIVPHQVTYATEAARVEAVGTARARTSAVIYPEVSGEVLEVNFTAGEKVSKDQVPVRLESRAEQLAIRQAEVAREEADQLIERYNQVSRPGIIAGNEIDRARSARDTAEIQLAIAQEALADRVFRAGIS